MTDHLEGTHNSSRDTETVARSFHPACFLCRYWQEDQDDSRRPRWGYCLRPASSPPSLMQPVADDVEQGAALTTHPKFACVEFSE